MSDNIHRMNVGEVITLLQDFNPNDKLMIITTSRNIGYITGLDQRLMVKNPYVVLTIDYDNVIEEVEELEADIEKQMNELQELKDNIDRRNVMLAIEKKNKGLRREYHEQQEKLSHEEEMKRKKEQNKKERQARYDECGNPNRTAREQVLAGFIPASGRGRPRKFPNPKRELKNLITEDRIMAMTDVEFDKFVDLLVEDYNRMKRRHR